MKPLDDSMRRLAEATARVIAKAEEIGLPDAPGQLAAPHAIRCLARAHIELRHQLQVLRSLATQTDPNDPLRAVLSQAGLTVPTASAAVTAASQTYLRVMRDALDFAKHSTFIVRQWDGMDGCWTNCTGEISCAEALRVWATYTADGTRHVAYAEITYYAIFPGGTRMHWDGADGREMHR